MHRRRRALVGVALLAGGLLGLSLDIPPVAAVPLGATDRAGDTLTDAVEEPITAPAADIVATSADSQPEGITLAFRVAKAADPAVDLNWSSSLTIATWELDVNGDSKADYVIDYYRDEETKVLTADLDRVGPGHPPDECQPRPGYGQETGYTVVVDPKCLGGATALSYNVTLAYTTDAKDDAADVATDISPDQGWTGPVAVTLPAGAAPVALVPPTDTIPPPGAKSKPPTTPEAAADPLPDSTNPSATAPKRVVPQQAAPGPRTSSASPSTATAPALDLARTGLGDRTVRMAGFALGIGLIGIGLLFANRRSAAR